MRPQSAKAKGRLGQQELCNIFLKEFPQLEPDDVRSNPMGAPGEDVLLSPAARNAIGGLEKVQCEVKRSKAISAVGWMKQAAGHGTHSPRLFFRQDGRSEPWYVCMPLESYFKLVKKVKE